MGGVAAPARGVAGRAIDVSCAVRYDVWRVWLWCVCRCSSASVGVWVGHAQGTEVKAITYSSMKVIEAPGRVEICVILDI